MIWMRIPRTGARFIVPSSPFRGTGGRNAGCIGLSGWARPMFLPLAERESRLL